MLHEILDEPKGLDPVQFHYEYLISERQRPSRKYKGCFQSNETFGSRNDS